MNIIDRTQGHESPNHCYIVTGSIGPEFEPLLFTSKSLAVQYAKQIIKHGKAHDVFPPFTPVIETRHKADMHRFTVHDKIPE
ncbi:hypothetical protein PAK_P30098 [Pseudomonas phage PAK_P3]|uniref:Uncharacterized protein n=11 Tax=Nankokuvirus TaxID=1925779 RepID=A0A218L465_9CAUD|nr:hypothetical protein [Pseudomonas aeruginosa]YP_008856974.1 hypothetical protein X832_gp098 [Pseudomonas phage PAK_P5]YP_008857733.1 hypothetical protein PAK_P30098 [Pseudomonas phage PAK_P3]YP_008858121.1 hypothetical protein X837_gp098 [Pseudomonas phage CHA_P1]YP_009206108.1 hypothetical protein AVT15_gp058 [Pseudomonas phage vB_PaeM_PS24]YP_009604773.1 hypothetical protein FDH93_gp146 [Pseudomonas phage vB_PaeM_G1]AGS81711.1 hypothetical protein P3_CHA0099 [Pseudomonas phage P3_CHA]QE